MARVVWRQWHVLTGVPQATVFTVATLYPGQRAGGSDGRHREQGWPRQDGCGGGRCDVVSGGRLGETEKGEEGRTWSTDVGSCGGTARPPRGLRHPAGPRRAETAARHGS